MWAGKKWHFFVYKSACWKVGMLAFRQRDLSRKKLAYFSVHTSKLNLSKKTFQGEKLLAWTTLSMWLEMKYGGKAQAKRMQHVACTIVGSCCNMLSRGGQTNATLCNMMAKHTQHVAWHNVASVWPAQLPCGMGRGEISVTNGVKGKPTSQRQYLDDRSSSGCTEQLTGAEAGDAVWLSGKEAQPGLFILQERHGRQGVEIRLQRNLVHGLSLLHLRVRKESTGDFVKRIARKNTLRKRGKIQWPVLRIGE